MKMIENAISTAPNCILWKRMVKYVIPERTIKAIDIATRLLIFSHAKARDTIPTARPINPSITINRYMRS